ncbi:MAG: hypothetical protein DWQ44_13270 [Bacteroidetes bacterium]|nr:MAG: hypothetical protein DWQ33_13655 [Bacteroidota bacterium]REK05764.1 MAG: hypothetical protein DWQ39_04980 [Bacteroidota bacterium]REK31930.1 MAG: hypothetical protein DWQ44_13270 [Bacteroidota bacterium]REK49995.1 MAG: hypothetical protein DWQ48_05490 [Bacteroidota bacterium]
MAEENAKQSVGLKQRGDMLLFYILCILSVLPLFTLKIFYTLEGPQQSYFAGILANIWKGNEIASMHFTQTGHLSPGSSIQYLLAIFQLVFSAIVSEKIFQFLYIILAAFAFRLFLKKLYLNTKPYSLLIFPLLFSFPFFTGAYSVLAGFVILFLILAYFISSNVLSLKRLTVLSLLLLVACFTDTLSFVLAFLFITLYQLTANKGNDVTKRGSIIPILITCFPSFLYLWFFTEGQSLFSTYSFEMFLNQAKELVQLRSFIVFNREKEIFYSMALGLLIALAAVRTFTSRKKLQGNILFLTASLVLIALLYFFIPAIPLFSGSSAHMMQVYLLSFLICIAAVSNIDNVSRILIGIILIISAINYILNLHPVQKINNQEVIEHFHASSQMRSDATVLHLDYSGNWFTREMKHMLDDNKSLMILNASYGFGNLFNANQARSIAPFIQSDLNAKPCPDLKAFHDQCNCRTDYIILWKKQNVDTDCKFENEILKSEYELLPLTDAPHLQLWQRKQLSFVSGSRKQDFENYQGDNLLNSVSGSRFMMKENLEFSPGLEMKLIETNLESSIFFQGSVKVYGTSGSSEAFLILSRERGGEILNYIKSDVLQVHSGEGEFFIQMEISDPHPDDLLKCYVWKPGGGTIIIDDLNVNWR